VLSEGQAILIAGIPRSGSTWQYNAVRLLITASGRRVHAAWCGDYITPPEGVTSVIKVHTPDEGSIVSKPLVLTTRRDLIDTLQSLVRVGWSPPNYTSLRGRALQQLHMYVHWAKRSSHETLYDDIINKPIDELRNLSKSLKLELGDEQIKEVSNKLEALKAPEGNGRDMGLYDLETLLHPDHRSNESTKKFEMNGHAAGTLRAELSYWKTINVSSPLGQKVSVPL
jgi:hypothetical protein